MKYTTTFICQSGFLEVQSLILASSLRKNLLGDVEIVAACPINFGKLHPKTLQIFNKLDVQIKYFINDFSPTYYMANKPFALSLFDGAVLFLDSDIISMKPFHPTEIPDCDVFCFCEDPFLSYSHNEWANITSLFGVILPDCPKTEINLQCMNTPMVYCRDGKTLGNKWVDFTRKLHGSNIKIKRKRKMANMCFGMAVRALELDFHVSEPITWDGQANWWSYPICNCHMWEKRLPISKRKLNSFLSSPDVTYYYENKELKSLGLPYFFYLQNGFGYCPFHQGGDMPMKIGLDHYPEVRSAIYSLLAMVPQINQHEEWHLYEERYFKNTDRKWFQKPSHYGSIKCI